MSAEEWEYDPDSFVAPVVSSEDHLDGSNFRVTIEPTGYGREEGATITFEDGTVIVVSRHSLSTIHIQTYHGKMEHKVVTDTLRSGRSDLSRGYYLTIRT